MRTSSIFPLSRTPPGSSAPNLNVELELNEVPETVLSLEDKLLPLTYIFSVVPVFTPTT